MASFKRVSLIMMTATACAALSACDGAADIASPGTGGNVIINNPPAPTPSPTPTPTTALVSPATGCPTIADAKGLADDGTITGPTGTWRVCKLPAILAASTGTINLPKIAGLLYEIDGRVDVGCDGGFSVPNSTKPSNTTGCTSANGFAYALDTAGTNLAKDTNVTLNIEPGVIVFAKTGTSWLAVNRGNKINAVGTATKPIIFTSRDNILGINTDNSIGQWGGVVMMGRARVTDCKTGTSTAANTCERETEGAVSLATFGGLDDTYNAGSIKYTQIRYSGYVLSADKELQSLTAEGVGTGTTFDYFQSHNSSDDGAEFFGGSVKFKHYIATGADDDSLDIDTGLQGMFQYLLLLQRPGQGDALMEIDSDGNETDTPRQKTAIVNFTALQPQTSSNNEGSGDKGSILVRGNSDIAWANGIVATPNNECLRMNASGTTPATLLARAVVMQCNATKYLGTGTPTPYTPAQVAAFFGSGTNGNNDGYTPSLTSLFINGATETAVTAFDPTTFAASAALDASFFDKTTYIGAVKDAADSWYKGWTCNASYAAFDDTANANRSCLSIPTN